MASNKNHIFMHFSTNLFKTGSSKAIITAGLRMSGLVDANIEVMEGKYSMVADHCYGCGNDSGHIQHNVNI